MPKGTVKWFNNLKGYGFIMSEDGEQDVFAHFSAITMDGYKTLKAGQQVNFELAKGEKGLHATNITALDDLSTVKTPELPDDEDAGNSLPPND